MNKKEIEAIASKLSPKDWEKLKKIMEVKEGTRKGVNQVLDEHSDNDNVRLRLE
jgi:hydrogenase maturation factor